MFGKRNTQPDRVERSHELRKRIVELEAEIATLSAELRSLLLSQEEPKT
jgi:hypothetical protein